MNSLVIGMGEVGTAVADVTGSEFELDRQVGRGAPKPGKIDVMHICFPYSETFVNDVQNYMARFEPKHIIVWSTVPIGTCRQIDERVCHTPVEGVHPHLTDSIRDMERWVAYNIGEEGRFFKSYFTDLSLRTRGTRKTETTELLKLRSTAKYGINIVWAQYEQELCDKYGVSYGAIMAFDTDYNDLYRELGLPEFQRYVLFPPDGEIGGHCIVPNAKLLNEQMPSDLLDKIIEMEKE